MQTYRNALQQGQKAISVEISPPHGTNTLLCVDRVRALNGMAHAVNIPDSQRALLKMSSMATAKLIQDQCGIDTVWQLTTRDRNVLALQADAMGAWALGLENILCLTGDPIAIGDQADVAKQVSHIEALRLIELIQSLNKGQDAAGNALKHSGTNFLIGSAFNPNKMGRMAQIHRLKYKIKLGVDFFQTQPVYDPQQLVEAKALIEQLAQELGKPVPKLCVGIMPLKSAAFARFLNDKLPGVEIPESIINALENTNDIVKENQAICRALVNDMNAMSDGFHFMPVAFEKHAPELLEACLSKV